MEILASEEGETKQKTTIITKEQQQQQKPPVRVFQCFNIEIYDLVGFGCAYLTVTDIISNTDNIGTLVLIYFSYWSYFDNSQNLLELKIYWQNRSLAKIILTGNLVGGS